MEPEDKAKAKGKANIKAFFTNKKKKMKDKSSVLVEVYKNVEPKHDNDEWIDSEEERVEFAETHAGKLAQTVVHVNVTVPQNVVTTKTWAVPKSAVVKDKESYPRVNEKKTEVPESSNLYAVLAAEEDENAKARTGILTRKAKGAIIQAEEVPESEKSEVREKKKTKDKSHIMTILSQDTQEKKQTIEVQRKNKIVCDDVASREKYKGRAKVPMVPYQELINSY